MSIPTEPTATTEVPGHTARIGSVGAVWWGIKRLVRSPILLVVAAISGGLTAISAGAGIGEPVGIASFSVPLFLSAVTYRHAGLAFGDVDDTRDLFVGTLPAVARMIGGYLILTIGVFLLFFVLLLAGVIGVILMIPAILLFFIHTALIFPAVCLDEGLINGSFKGWDLARDARGTLFGLLLLTGIPLWIFEAAVANTTTAQQAAFGLGWGVLWVAMNLATARVYDGLR